MYLQKKDAFYQNQSHWLETPMIHLMPHWNHEGMEGEEILVRAYTNCEETELFLNGRCDTKNLFLGIPFLTCHDIIATCTAKPIKT